MFLDLLPTQEWDELLHYSSGAAHVEDSVKIQSPMYIQTLIKLLVQQIYLSNALNTARAVTENVATRL